MQTEPLNVLIVDDMAQNLVALEALLRRSSLSLVSARSGAEALEHCLAKEFCLALIDVQMPGMDGFELAELMRGADRTKHVPIIFVTAGARDQQRMFQGYESGAVDYLYKPLDPQILTSKVNVFLELAQQRRDVTKILQLNELFVGIVGHDLRNPLSAIISGLELLHMTNLDAQQVRVVERMTSSSRRMERMINELLDLTHARLGPGLGMLRTREPLELRELLSRAIEELRTAYDREITLVAPGTFRTSGDSERMLQLFSNLLANAITHGQKDHPITARLSAGAGRTLVEVHNGGAIPDDVAHTLFEPFKRARDPQGGLGLGLYIAHQIAKAHGGDITVASSAAAGTTFTVRLPS